MRSFASRLLLAGAVPLLVGCAREKPDYPEIQPNAPALVFRVQEGDASDLDRVLEIIGRRLHIAGHGDLGLGREEDALLVAEPEEEADVELVKELVLTRYISLEFHITVEKSERNFHYYWMRLKSELDRGTPFEQIRYVRPDDRAGEDKDEGRYPFGLTWYRLSARARDIEKPAFSGARLPGDREPYVLCRSDNKHITGDSLQGISFRRDTQGIGGYWMVVFNVRKLAQGRMASLTANEGEHLAIIFNDEVDSAPVLRSPLSENGQITGSFTREEAGTLAAILGSESLPCRLAFAGRRN